MNIILNNNNETFNCDSMTVSEMLKMKNYSYKLRVVKINGTFIPREDYEIAVIREGDNIQMHYLMSGG